MMRCPPNGTMSFPICQTACCRRLIRKQNNRWARKNWPPCFPWDCSNRKCPLPALSISPRRFRRFSRSGDPRRWSGPHNLEKALGTKAKIFFKNEGVSPVGSHKLNSAVAQAYYNKREGVKRLTTETGAGQWGSALSLAANKFGLECKVYMVRVSFDQKPYRKSIMQTFGATVVASPSIETKTGRTILEQMPDTPGSLGIAISEALEDAFSREDTKYALGSVLNHVILHQSIIGLEAKKQMEIAGEYPDVIVGCCGGGSNFAGLATPYLPDYLEGKKIRFVGTEPASCPTLTAGKLAYDFGDVAQTTPLLYMYTLGHDFIPPGIHAGGLRYHGMSPIVSAMVREKIVEPVKLHQLECFEAGVLFARTEGIIPGPGNLPCHSRRHHRGHAKPDEPKTILFNFSGHGLIDMGSYDKYYAGLAPRLRLSGRGDRQIDGQPAEDLKPVP